MEQDQPVPKRQSTFPQFSKYFNSHPQDVVEYVTYMRKQMEDFIEAFKKRIEIEINYSKSLTQVSKLLDKYIKPGTELATSYICSAFKVQNEQRSRQAVELAQALKTQIETMCTQMLKNETNYFKKMEKDIKRFYKEAGAFQESHRDALTRFEGISKQMQQMIITKNIMKYTTGIPQEKKVKLISKTMESIKQHKEYEKLYLNSVKDFNLFANSYTNEITNQLNEAQKMVREQVIMQGDCLRKLIVAQVSMFKNIEYDLLNISKQMEYLDTQKDVQIFVEQNKNNLTNRIITQQKSENEVKRNSLIYDSGALYGVIPKKYVGKSMLSNSLLHVDEQYFSWMLFNKKNKKLREIISIIWKKLKKQHKDASSPEKKQFNQQNKTDTINNVVKNQNNSLLQESNKKTEEKNQSPDISPELESKKQEISTQIVGDYKLQPPKENQKVQGVVKQVNNAQIKEQKKQQINQQTPIINELDWQTQLKNLLSSFKMQQPPSFSQSTNNKKDKQLELNIVFNAFVQITGLIFILWNNQESQIQDISIKLDRLQKYLSEHHIYRLFALIFLEQYRLQQQVMINSSGCAKMCGRVIKSIIKESQKQNDTFIIRGILGLIFTFYWVDDKYKKLIYVNSEIYQSDIWKKSDFWQAAIFETTYEQMAVFTKQKGQSLAETILRQKNLIFSQLASFCHYMVMLGTTSKNVRLIVGRYCRLYEMSEEQNKDLSKMITNTTKQFKETAFAFNLKAAERQKSVIND